MRPAMCRTRHDPENGSYGDCVRACVATLMNLDCEQVPHFYADNCAPEAANKRINDWLNERGFAPFWAYYDGATSLIELFQMHGEMNPDAHYMLFGSTIEGDHVVVCKGGAVVHNPAWFPSSIVKPHSSGTWAIMVIAKG